VTTLFYLTSEYNVYLKRSPTLDGWASEQERRKENIKQVCDLLSTDNIRGKKHSSRSLFVPKENFLWCRVPKAGTSTWTHGTLSNLTSGKGRIGIQSSFQMDKRMKSKVEEREPISLIVARHPFERLMSAFLDKVHGRTFLDFLQNTVIPESEMPNCTPKIIGSSCVSMNIHWRPIHSLCHPCNVNFSVISKMETFSEDRWRVHEMLGLDHLNQGEKRMAWNVSGGSKTTNLTSVEFRKVPVEVKNKLRSIYQLDFQLFDYDPNLY